MPGQKDEDYHLKASEYCAIGYVGVISACGWVLAQERRVTLFNANLTIFRTVCGDSLFEAEDYRNPLAMILESNSDLLDELQIKILTSALW